MIQATELRIGNLLTYDMGDGTFENSKLDWQDIRWCFENNKDFNLAHKPIPLTEDWIRDFGFVFEDIGTNPTEEEKRYLVARKGYGTKEIEIEFDRDLSGLTLGNFTGELLVYYHVHQLQNLYYALTQQELELRE